MSGETSWSERLRSAPARRGWATSPAARARGWLVAGAAGAVAAVVAGVSLAVLASLPPARTTLIVPAAVEGRGNTLTESGELISGTVTPVYLTVSGEVAWLIEEGTIVKSGDVITRIDSSSLESRLEQYEYDHVPRETAVKGAEQALASAQAIGPLNARLAEIRLEVAEWKLEDLRHRPTKEDLEGARIDLRVAELAREKESGELERTAALAKRGFATETELRERRLKALDAEAEAALAKLVMEIVSLGATDLSREAARLAVERAKLAVEKSTFAGEADVVIAEKALDVARAQLARSESDFDGLKLDVANMEVKATAAGRVTFPEVWRWTKDSTRIEVGETLNRGLQICEIADPSRLQARIHVNEIDALELKVGLPARACLTAYPGVDIPGRVVRIGRSAEDKNERLGELALNKAGRAEVGVVEVLVDLDLGRSSSGAGVKPLNPTDLRGGHTVSVEIDLDGSLVEEDEEDEEGGDAPETEGEGGRPDA